jgi:hypothetical protein
MPVAAGELLRISAWEVGCGLTGATFRVAPAPGPAGGMQLESEVADAAGNRRPIAWGLQR